MATVSLSELLGSTVYDASGVASGRVREVALAPQEDRCHVASLIVKTPAGNRVLPLAAISTINGGIRASTLAAEWMKSDGSEGLLLLGRDLLDQQVIDVHGRKVVRVNDVDFYHEIAQNHPVLKVEGVDVGARGAIRRLSKAWSLRLPFGSCSCASRPAISPGTSWTSLRPTRHGASG